MNTKVRFIKSSFLVSLFLFFLCAGQLYAGGVLAYPRKVYVIRTNYFEIIFPKESEDAAYFIAEKADSLYEAAKAETGLKYDFFMPIIVSPDSVIPEVKYTNEPYNRIVVFDANARESLLETLLYKEIFRAVSFSIRSPINEIIHKYTSLGDKYQPIALINLPFSFSEAYADIASGTTQDNYFQQLLIQAKLEGRFPSWLQASAARDIYPGNDLCFAAGTGFAAFLMATRGLAKYSEFWTECGKLHPYLTDGICHKIYGSSLTTLWKEFEESIPQPQNLLQTEPLALSAVMENDHQGSFENILHTRYGLVWYDRIRHEVDIYDYSSSFKIRQLLFLAEDITKLSLSPDERYISATFIRDTVRPEFKEIITRVFDLRERKFIGDKYEISDACFVKGNNNEPLLAGLALENNGPVLKVYSFLNEENQSVQIYEKGFEKSQMISGICSAGKNKLGFLLSDSDDQIFVIENIRWEEPARFWSLKDENNEPLVPVNLQYIEAASLITFSFYPQETGALVRSGYITMTEDGGLIRPDQIFLQNGDISGGVYYPFVSGDKLYYCSKLFSHNELCYLSFNALSYVEGNVIEILPNERSEVLAEEMSEKSSDEISEPLFDVSRYNPFKYMLDISAIPFLAVRDITLDSGPVLWPSVGLYATAGTDPMHNTELMLSACAGFIELSYEKEINTVPNESYERYNSIFQKKKKFNLAGYIKNSSTPVDIEAGVFCNFNKDGDYNFKAVAKTAWGIPVGTILRDMEFSIGSIYLSSTDYYDENKVDYHPPMEGWTVITDAYELFEVSATVKYSTSHQYGISQYERRGLDFGARIYSLWDLYEINLLNQYRDETANDIKSGKNTQLTEAQLQNSYNNDLLKISQLNLGLFAKVDIPCLTPLKMHRGWVLSVPATVRAELMNRTGTALDVSVEALLIGNEIQNGIRFLYLFFSRAGLLGGYNFTLDYDTTKVRLPDIRNRNYLAEVFSQTEFSDSVYLILNTDFLIPAGTLSQVQFNMDVRSEYFIRTNGFKFSFNVNAVF